MSLRARRAEVQLAVMLLTRLPVGRIAGEAPDLAAARWAFPLVGLPLGLGVWAVSAGAATLGAGPLIAALLALAALALLTGALHFDGLADYADGIGGGRDKAHALEIMRDSRIGSYGMLAMIVTVGLWVAAVAEVQGNALTFIAVAALSRAAMVALQEVLPPARDDGMGHMAAGRNRAARIMVALTSLAALILWPLPFLTCAGVTLALGWQAKRRIGGQTGDVLGAAQLLSETAIWVTLACL